MLNIPRLNKMLLLLETVLLLEVVLLFFSNSERLTCACIRVRAINRVNTVY